MSNTVTAIIVDDEAHARRTLETMLQLHCHEVQIKEQCSNVPQAVLAIKTHQPQLVFLDIEMPEFNGFELIKFFDEINFEIIFVTAYSEYAIRAFELSAVDYLLKPVQQDKLKAAIEKLKAKQANQQLKERLELLQSNLQNEEFTRIALPVTDGLLFVEVSNIVYVEADGAYSKVYLSDASCVTVSRKIKFFEEMLTKRKPFFRTHRSYVVNLNYVCKYNRLESYITLESEISLPVSKDRKKEFEESFSEIRIGR
jgi:two-component system LytT family response regulator